MEEEIILEPELKFLVENAVCPSKKNNFIHIKCKFEEPSKVLENIIGPDNIKLVYKISDEYIKYIYFKFYNKFNPIKENKNIKIFGSKFIKNIIDKCKYIYKGKEYELQDFLDISNIKNNQLEIILKGFQNDINDMSYMFFKCQRLNFSDISKLVTSSATNINNIFSSCKFLSSLPDISKWDTSNFRKLVIYLRDVNL